MTNAIVPFNTDAFGELAVYSEAFGAVANAFTSGIGSTMPAHISRRGGRFTPVDDEGVEGEPSLKIVAQIINANPVVSRTYYEGKYDPQEAIAPDCLSDNGLTPSLDAPKPQSETCAACPNAVWGSATSQMSGKPIPACKQHKKLAVKLLDEGDDGTTYLFTVPAASMKPFEKYVRMLEAKARSTPYVVWTEFSFDSDNPNVLRFKPVGFITKDRAELTAAWVQDDKGADIVRKHDRPAEIGAARPAPKADPAAAAPAQKPRPAPAAVEDPDVIELKKRREAKAAAEAAKAAQPPEFVRPEGLDNDDEWEELKAYKLEKWQKAQAQTAQVAEPASDKPKQRGRPKKVEDLPNPIAAKNGNGATKGEKSFGIDPSPKDDSDFAAQLDTMFSS